MNTKPFIPAPIEVVVNGETLQIRPFPFGKLATVTAKLAPIFGAFQGLTAGSVVAYGDVLEAGGEGLMDVLCLAAGKPYGYMDAVYDVAEGEALARAVFEANRDMLQKKVMPLILKLMKAQAVAPVQG